MPDVQREYKDRFFNYLFGSEENKRWTLSLYNAVNGSDYSDPDIIQFNTIKEVIYLGMHNDVSFLIANEMSLYEQQSTFNPNMPLRMLQHLGQLYEKHIKKEGLNKFGQTLIQLPVPRLVVFYNRRNETEEEIELRLSDSFPADTGSDVEVKVRMINVNYGRNKKILDSCEPLKEYAWLVDEIRRSRANETEIGIAVDEAINTMPDSFLIKPFLVAHKAEVRDMLLTEYNEAETMKLFEKDGARKECERVATDMLKDRKPIDEITRYSRLSETVIREIAKKIGVAVVL